MPCRVVPAARKGNVGAEDLPLPEEQQAEVAYEEFNRSWEEAVAEAKTSGKQPRLRKVRLVQLP